MRQCEPDRVVDAGQVSRRRIDRLMRGAGLAGKTKRKFKATTHSKHNLAVTDKHLDRQFAAHQPDQVYAGDITTIYTQEGWRYWAVVIDLFFAASGGLVYGWGHAGNADQ